MTTVSRTFTVTPEPSTVLDYLTDFAHAEQWDPGTETCTRNDAGPVEVGSNWHNVSKIAGATTELTYTLEKRTADALVFVGRNDTATSTDTISVSADGAGSRITYEADLEMHGVAKLATPAMKLLFEKLGNDTEKQMTEVLNRLSAADLR
jgi:carbon monoxide dehydrogenase subunit G